VVVVCENLALVNWAARDRWESVVVVPRVNLALGVGAGKN